MYNCSNRIVVKTDNLECHFIYLLLIEGFTIAFKKVSKGIYEYLKGRPAIRQSLYINYRDVDGTPKKTKVKTMDVSEAKKLLALKKAEIVKKKKVFAGDVLKLKRAIDFKKLTLDKMAELYFEQRRTVLNKEDKRTYEIRVSPKLGSKLVVKISTEDIQALQDFLQTKYAPKTLNETINSLRALFNRGIKKGWCDYNPVDRSEVKKLEEPSENHRVLDDEELENMFNVIKNGDYDLEIASNQTLFLFCKIAYFSGARPAAILDLKVKHINFKENTIHLKAMKHGKSYNQKIRQEVMDMIAQWIKKHSLKHIDNIFYPQQTFFRTGDITVKQSPILLTSIQRASRKVFEKLFNSDIPKDDRVARITLYSLRRTAGTNRYKKKGLVSAMKFLNHTKIDTTMIYLNVSDDFTEEDDDGL